MTKEEIAKINKDVLAVMHDNLQAVLIHIFSSNGRPAGIPLDLNPETQARMKFYKVFDWSTGAWADINSNSSGPDVVSLVVHMADLAADDAEARDRAAIALRNHIGRLSPTPAPSPMRPTLVPAMSGLRRSLRTRPTARSGGSDPVATPLDIATLNVAALRHRSYLLSQLAYKDGRVTPEVRSLNDRAPRIFGLLIRMDELGYFTATSDTGFTHAGRGACELVAALASVEIERASTFVARIVKAAEASA